MKTSEQINEIAGALAKAQAEIQNPSKDQTNPHFRSKYADLAGGLDTVRPTLGKHGLSIVQMTQCDGEIITLHSRLMHSSGQWLESSYPVCKLGPHQQMGAAMTYARRYCLFALIGVAGAFDEDDGNTAPTARRRPGERTEAERTVVEERTLEAPSGQRKSSNAIKKNDPEAWPKLEADVRAASSRDELNKIWNAQEAEIVTWPTAWRAQVDELFISRLDEIEGRSGLGDLEAAE